LISTKRRFVHATRQHAKDSYIEQGNRKVSRSNWDQRELPSFRLKFNFRTRTRPIMKTSSSLFAVISLSFVAFALPSAALSAGDTHDKSLTVAAAQSSKDKKSRACRVRHRDCLNKNQIPSFECEYIYRDCINNIY
jgi:hypothetical protein